MPAKTKDIEEAEPTTMESGKPEDEYLVALDVQQRRIAELAGFEAENRGLREEVEKQQAQIDALSAQVETLSSSG